MKRPMQEGKPRTLLFSFPFIVLVDTRDSPQVEMMRIEQSNIRIYPPFRSGPANWLPMPPIQTFSVPFLDGRRPKHIRDDGSILMTLSAYPQLAVPGLQEMSIQWAWGKKWDGEKPPILFPMDSLRLDIIPDPKCPSYEATANALVTRLMGHIRCLTSQWWITHSSDTLIGWMRNEFQVDNYGKPDGEILASSKSRSPFGWETALTQAKWEAAIRLVESGVEPDVVDLLMLDAQYFSASSDWRRMVLDAATACEIAKDEACERLWNRINSIPYKRGRHLQGWNITMHLDSGIKAIGGRSLKDEEPEVYANICRLWDSRGNVAHGEEAYFREAGRKVSIGGETAKVIIASTIKCVRWLRAL